MDFIPAELSPFVVIIVAVVVMWLVWRVISGLIRFVLTLGITVAAIYIIWILLGNLSLL